MLADALPLELLARALGTASGLHSRTSFDWRGLKTLCAARAVSQHFRAAVDVVLEGCWELWLNEEDSLPAGVLDSPLATRVTTLTLIPSKVATLCRGQAFRHFIAQCTRLHYAKVYNDSAATAAFVEGALCCSPSLTCYDACGYTPRLYAPQLSSLVIQPGLALGQADSLELSLISARQLPGLCSIQVDVEDLDGQAEPPCVTLRASQLAGLRLPALTSLELQLHRIATGAMDFSWLAKPRSFCVTLRLRDEHLATVVERWAVLRALSDILQPQDSLDLDLEADSPALLEGEQLALKQMELATLELTVPAGTRVTHLPRSGFQELFFAGGEGTAELEWAAVSQQAGMYCIYSRNVQLQVLGCLGGAPALAGGWHLQIMTQHTVLGLPAASFSMDAWGGCTYELKNQYAADHPDFFNE